MMKSHTHLLTALIPMATLLWLPNPAAAGMYDITIEFTEKTSNTGVTCVDKIRVRPKYRTIDRGDHLEWFGGKESVNPPNVTWMVVGSTKADYKWYVDVEDRDRRHFEESFEIPGANSYSADAKLDGGSIIWTVSKWVYTVRAEKDGCGNAGVDPEVIFNGGGGKAILLWALLAAIVGVGFGYVGQKRLASRRQH